MSNKDKIVFIVGPTAVGKSKIAIMLAKELDGEILSCDSMQVYKEINIASAKPSFDDQNRVKHHLIDLVSVEDEFDVARFRRQALEAVDDVISRVKLPILVGGSGLYMQILLDGIFEGTEKDENFRKELRKKAELEGSSSLHKQLSDLDPATADKIHPNDMKRIIRAIEVCTLKKKPMSEIKQHRKGMWNKYDIRIFCLDMDREKLYERINARVDDMFRQGIIDEVKAIDGRKLSLTSERIIGVKEILDYLNGLYSEEETKEMIKMNTRRYAKRQLTWFRKEERLQRIDITNLGENDIINTLKERINE